MYRTIKIRWLPKSKLQWEVFTKIRQEAGRLWSDLVDFHEDMRKNETEWVWEKGLLEFTKGNYPYLHSQSIQQIVRDFCDVVKSTIRARKNGIAANYPKKKMRYRDVIFTGQQSFLRNGHLILSNGKRGKLVSPLVVKLPKNCALPGELAEVCLKYGELILICKVVDRNPPALSSTIGIDLGVNTLISATDGNKAICISGREAKSINQYKNKQLASLQSKQSKYQKGSGRFKRIQRRKHKILDKCKRKIHDICHKATRRVINEFPKANISVGEPFNDAAQKTDRVRSQQIQQHCGHKIIHMLSYKTSGETKELKEYFTSQTCPNCGQRNKCNRIYLCKCCGFTRPRDVIGASNILSLGRNDKMIPGCPVPNSDCIKFVHPIKYPVPQQVVPKDTGQVALETENS